MTNMPVIDLSNAQLSFGDKPKHVDVLKGINLSIEAGETVGVLGASGAGKTSLLMVMAGLENVTGGTIALADHDITNMAEDALAALRRDKVGIVFQAFRLIASMTALQNVSIPLELAGDPDATARASAALESVGLGHRLHHLPDQMSGGEQQRVSIARAFVNRPLILLADEPTGNLDPATSVGIMRLLDRINRSGTTVVMATHDRGIVDTMRRRVIELDRGILVRDESRGVYE